MALRNAHATYSPFASTSGGGAPQEDLVAPDGRRRDGRLPEECRPAFLKTGTVSQAAGSAYVELANSKVLVAVYGPRPSYKAQSFSDVGRLHCDVKVASFATTTRGKYGQGPGERDFSIALHRGLEGAVALHTFPKAAVDVFALVLQSGGSELAVTITCAALALADAGIEMLDLVAATSLSVVNKQLLLDPTTDEERAEEAGVLVACMPARNEITQLMLSGEWEGATSAEAIELCVEGCSRLDQLMRSALKESAEAPE